MNVIGTCDHTCTAISKETKKAVTTEPRLMLGTNTFLQEKLLNFQARA